MRNVSVKLHLNAFTLCLINIYPSLVIVIYYKQHVMVTLERIFVFYMVNGELHHPHTHTAVNGNRFTGNKLIGCKHGDKLGDIFRFAFTV